MSNGEIQTMICHSKMQTSTQDEPAPNLQSSPIPIPHLTLYKNRLMFLSDSTQFQSEQEEEKKRKKMTKGETSEVREEAGTVSRRTAAGGGGGAMGRGAAILDFILRVVAVIGTLASAIAMGTTNETLPFFTQFVQFQAQYNDLPSLTFFVVANSIVCSYLVFSLMLSILHIIRTNARKSRLLLIFFDTAMLALLTAGASAAAAIVYLAHKGNVSANWFAICQQFNSFCQRISGSLIGSFGAMVILVLLVFLSAAVLSKR